MTVAGLIDYIKLATRTLDTVLSDAELLTVTKLAMNRVYEDLKVLFDKEEFTSFTSEDTTVTLSTTEVYNVAKAYIELTNGKRQYLIIDDIRDNELYISTDDNMNISYIFHAKEYAKVSKLVMVYSTPLILTDIVEATLVPQRLLEAIMSYVAYSTYKLLGLKDLEVALFHKQEYLQTIEKLKTSHNINHKSTLALKETDIIAKGFV